MEGGESIKNISDSSVLHKDQSNLNRFIIDQKWDYRALNRRRVELVEDEFGMMGSEVCFLLLDDINIKRYHRERIGYHHDSKQGLIRGHNCVIN